ncbi:MAG: hypothetical protein WAU81_03275 [Candidatus Aminicenantales bacterium]
MFEQMIKRLLAGVGFVVLALSLGSSVPQETKPAPQKTPPLDSPLPPQEYPAKKPKYDYMSSFFSRNTKPLGLKEDLAVKKLLKQPAIKWAVRTGQRNILN